ncbi:MAG: ATP-dependent zinc metalloprotease FtsH [Clostridia bacterium]|jgi:cell division protease FtsH|nr:ATP-dependent zinc metalloprotease FtsH [Clostridia bacterium]
MKNNTKSAALWIVVILGAVLLLSVLFSGTGAKEVPYSQMLEMFRNEEVVRFEVSKSNTLTFETKDGTKYYHSLRDVGLFYEDLGDEISRQLDKGTLVEFNYESTAVSIWVQLFPYLLVIGAFCLVWWLFISKTAKSGSGGGGLGGRMNSFNKARTKLGSDEKNKVYFKDVAGADEEKEELREVVEFLKNPQKFSDLGARIPRGVLLIGPPGTGKTLLAKAVAGESGVPFYSISGSDFVEMYVGVGASRVRDLFETAKKTAPCIVFIDEIDAVGRHRGAGLGGGHDEREQTLNQLLVEMDGFGVNDGVIVIAATNRPDILDPALMRPGRFDRQVTVNYPDLKGRAAILRVHARNKPLGQDVDLDTVAKSTVGMTGADLSNVLNEAALLAARRKKNVINMKEIEDATLKILVGPQKRSLMISESDKRKTAYHEAGHAIVGHILPTQDPVHQISIIPSGHALGYTLSLPESDKTSVYRIELQEEIATLLGGRVAEALILDDISGGASQDIQRATEIARKMVTRYGMSDKLGPIVYGNTDENVFLGKSSGYTIDYSEEFASAIDNEIYRIVTDGYQLAEKILKENMAILHFVADYLVKHETMDAEQFKLCFTADVTEEQVAALHPSEPELIVNPASEEILPEGKPSRSQIEEDGDFS